ncbi:MAG: serine/threonine-protein kinase [Kofleriaceae bacterium]
MKTADVHATTVVSGESTGAPDDDLDDLIKLALGMSRRLPPRALATGQIIDDAYRIEEVLGEGGMGRVYRAHDIRLGRDVAIKLHVVVAVDGQQWSLREASALARLSHPNAVTVYQVGTWSGHPWVAMEYVPGGTARTWLAAASRTPREILAMYVAAGRGLAAAHAAGIVHRDFKPDNVLVTDDGHPRVADFGLALELAKSDGRATNLVMGTPAYMAPEQWAREEIGPAADQFAFAVALWEALTGKRPFVGDSDATLRAALARPPAPPARPLPRHVEAGLRRALARDPAARWPGMPSLLAELGRDPQRTRRNLAGVAVAGVVLLGTGAGLASLRGRDAAPTASPCLDATADFATATRLRRVLPAANGDRALAKLDTWMTGWRTARTAACEDVHVRRIQPVALLELRELCLDRARATLEATLAELPRVKDRTGLVDELPPIAECADVVQLSNSAPLPADPAARAEIESISAVIGQVEVMRTVGRVEEALATITALVPRADATQRKALASEVRISLGANLIANNKLAGVLSTFEQAAKLAAEAHDDVLGARAWLFILDTLIARLERPADAESMVPVAEAAVLRAGNTPRLRAELVSSMGDVAMKRGNWALARDRYTEAIALQEQVYGENSELARTLNRLAAISVELGDLPAARTHLRRAADVLERNYGPRFRHLAVVWTTLGDVEHRAGNLEEARALFERGLALKEATSGPTSVVLVPTLVELASTLCDHGDLELATTHIRRALEIATRELGPAHAKVADATHVLARIQRARTDFRAAEQSVKEALAIQLRLGAIPPADQMELTLADIALRTGRPALARAAVARARPIAAAQGEGSYAVAKVHEMTGRVELALGHRDVGLAALEQAHTMLVVKRGAAHREVVAVQAVIDGAKTATPRAPGARDPAAP